MNIYIACFTVKLLSSHSSSWIFRKMSSVFCPICGGTNYTKPKLYHSAGGKCPHEWITLVFLSQWICVCVCVFSFLSLFLLLVSQKTIILLYLSFFFFFFFFKFLVSWHLLPCLETFTNVCNLWGRNISC